MRDLENRLDKKLLEVRHKSISDPHQYINHVQTTVSAISRQTLGANRALLIGEATVIKVCIIYRLVNSTSAARVSHV